MTNSAIFDIFLTAIYLTWSDLDPKCINFYSLFFHSLLKGGGGSLYLLQVYRNSYLVRAQCQRIFKNWSERSAFAALRRCCLSTFVFLFQKEKFCGGEGVYFWSTFSSNLAILSTFCFFTKKNLVGGYLFGKFFRSTFLSNWAIVSTFCFCFIKNLKKNVFLGG